MAYFEAIKAGQPTGSPAHIISGDRARWDAFDAYHPALVTARRIVAKWYANQPGPGGVILAGNPGGGKTHLAKAIAQMAGPVAVFVNEVDLFKSIIATYDKGSATTEEAILLRYKRAKMLVYDDLGAYRTQKVDWMQDIYYSLFNEREEAGLGLLITTNLALENWKTVDGDPVFVNSPLEDRMGKRVFSRVMGQVDKLENYVDLFAVPDYRTKGME